MDKDVSKGMKSMSTVRKRELVVVNDEDELMMTYGRVKKRQLVVADDAISKSYRFKILLPNGTSIGLAIHDPIDEMPIADFLGLVKDEYHRLSTLKKQRRPINWRDGCIFLEDANDNKIRNMIKFTNFTPHKSHILRLYLVNKLLVDCLVLQNMWDLTPHTELLTELPEEYTFETALADLIDNSLQAVWSNGANDRRLISVDILKNRISIYDSGPGMDSSDEKSIVNWGKMGASLHRSSKRMAIGGKPPYLMVMLYF
ncbi:hypothetical protein HS088_TW19G00865 [Tripterygium wilfordii]|uniref:Uncharacterized protein n=1 Tax=Tripterygium wilfordii TaxID=458696 RepID=A0A7J7CAW5_TRIWF|nr:hypothetical protein HS088_TW19G00865 [Tripterygium wilfordii]